MFITPRDGFDIAGQVATPKMKDFCPNYGNKEVNTQNVEKLSLLARWNLFLEKNKRACLFIREVRVHT